VDRIPSTGYLRSLKNFNKHAVLDLIRLEPGGISRAELARRIGISRAAVSVIVTDLLEDALVLELNTMPTESGRRPILLEINPMRGYVVGVDMGATHLSVALADLSARVIQEVETPFDITRGPEICLAEVDQQVHHLLDLGGIRLPEILNASVGVPGPIAVDSGQVIAPPIMPGWDRFPIRTFLEEGWGFPVSLNNDAELGALGEWAFGAGREENHVIYIKVGSGVGAGLILNNQIYHGEIGTAGEIGHVTIDEHGPLCTCGNHGCLEAMAGGRAIARQAQQAVLAGQRTQLSAIRPVERISARDVTLAARRGDLVAQQIVSHAGELLGTAIAGLINLLNPGVVVVGGGVTQAGDLLLEPIRSAVKGHSLKAAQIVRVTASVLGRRSATIGAIVQASSEVLHELIDRELVA
jgi:N-acetylglucosamine repressor